jgi:peroxiredoxin (alkyl hydroperoxide reductase subunit C)
MAVLVGKEAPDFNLTAVVNGGDMVDNFTLSQFKGQKYVILFFYPKDFTFVCPTEILAFQERLKDFEARNVQVIGASTDTEFSHWAWLNTPKDKGGIQGVTYPIIADVAKTVAIDYDVLAGHYTYEIDEKGNERMVFKGNPVAYRGLFLIDKQGIVRHQVVNDLPLGRSIDEALRMVDALIYVEQKGEVCPANWSEGKDGLVATHEGIASYLSTH